MLDPPDYGTMNFNRMRFEFEATLNQTRIKDDSILTHLDGQPPGRRAFSNRLLDRRGRGRGEGLFLLWGSGPFQNFYFAESPVPEFFRGPVKILAPNEAQMRRLALDCIAFHRITTLVPVKEMTGLRFGKLVGTARADNEIGKPARWHCLCDCGTKLIRSGSDLRRAPKDSQRCDECYGKAVSAIMTDHGETGAYLHTAWMGARRRCTDRKYPKWKNYGGRGITMFPKWQRDYLAYRDYILRKLGPRPSPDHTIDRIDNDDGYVPGNLRWATRSEQRLNTRPRGKHLTKAIRKGRRSEIESLI